eukprot:TRINITY_DN7925_c0_g1_i1.p1 TRINITY_DN7925_c0_g1~~TRINITY_DN7925_c0_g1_i1.p1  ORF type:complete len:235 (+),score=23.43 TRINITY_DN7925_c0_g1_i1:49-753(+)
MSIPAPDPDGVYDYPPPKSSSHFEQRGNLIVPKSSFNERVAVFVGRAWFIGLCIGTAKGFAHSLFENRQDRKNGIQFSGRIVFTKIANSIQRHSITTANRIGAFALMFRFFSEIAATYDDDGSENVIGGALATMCYRLGYPKQRTFKYIFGWGLLGALGGAAFSLCTSEHWNMGRVIRDARYAAMDMRDHLSNWKDSYLGHSDRDDDDDRKEDREDLYDRDDDERDRRRERRHR